MQNLNDMWLFVEVVKAKSFRGAASVIGVPNSTVSRRIGELENSLGLRLLNRTTRRIELTEAGLVYFERCKAIVEEARIAHDQLDQFVVSPKGTVRVSLPVEFGTIYLASHLAAFCAAYPDVELELDLTPRHADLIADRCDVAIRLGPLKDSTLIVRKLADVSHALYASPAYIERRGAPERPRDLAQHDCITFPHYPKWILYSKSGQRIIDVSGQIRVNNVGMMCALSCEGAGIAHLPDRITAAAVDAGKLRRVLSAWSGEKHPANAVTETRLLPAKTQRLIEFLQDRLRGQTL